MDILALPALDRAGGPELWLEGPGGHASGGGSCGRKEGRGLWAALAVRLRRRELRAEGLPALLSTAPHPFGHIVVLHLPAGDLSYANGILGGWENYMSMMSLFATRVPLLTMLGVSEWVGTACDARACARLCARLGMGMLRHWRSAVRPACVRVCASASG